MPKAMLAGPSNDGALQHLLLRLWMLQFYLLINPRRACGVGVTVLAFVCLCACLCVCLLPL